MLKYCSEIDNVKMCVEEIKFIKSFTLKHLLLLICQIITVIGTHTYYIIRDINEIFFTIESVN